jgi:hypothetical protein
MVIDTQGNNPAVEDKPLNIVEEARFLRDEIKKEKEALIKEREALQKVQAESLLSSSAGQPQPQQVLSEEDLKKKQAMDFWKGTGIDEAIAKNG